MTDTRTRPGVVVAMAEAERAHAAAGKPYCQFLTVPEMSAGLYVLPAGGEDPQQPHAEDEIYYVLSGRATVSIDGVDTEVGPGATIFVAKHVDHRFHTIEEELRLLVIFAPAHAT
jgi:mannose-6-phosphate isomerase-like protein (cupin superfamily)